MVQVLAAAARSAVSSGPGSCGMAAPEPSKWNNGDMSGGGSGGDRRGRPGRGRVAVGVVAVLGAALLVARCGGAEPEVRSVGRPDPAVVATTSPPTVPPTTRPVVPAPVTAPPAPVRAPVVAAAAADLDRLVVEAEGPRPGYDRGLFVHWVDDDGDGCDTRCEVLADERRTDLPGLTVGWLSIYDGYSTDNSSEFDVDHVVALAEAWDSGAWAWDASRRRAFANDLGDPRALIAVTAATNRSKSDRDPAEWQPPNRSAWCEFADAWIATKVRWGLTVDPAERNALANMLAGCPAGAPVTPVPAAPAAPPGPSPAPPAGDGGVYYANCTAARLAGAAPVRVGDPGYRAALDRDGDGVGCE